MTRAIWTARCKSGYTFHGRVCQRVTPRGMLLCADCLSAESIPTPREPSMARVYRDALLDLAIPALLVAVVSLFT
jgi:hypothetical protein